MCAPQTSAWTSLRSGTQAGLPLRQADPQRLPRTHAHTSPSLRLLITFRRLAGSLDGALGTPESNNAAIVNMVMDVFGLDNVMHNLPEVYTGLAGKHTTYGEVDVRDWLPVLQSLDPRPQSDRVVDLGFGTAKLCFAAAGKGLRVYGCEMHSTRFAVAEAALVELHASHPQVAKNVMLELGDFVVAPKLRDIQSLSVQFGN